MNTLGIIPARGGSKRVPRKNVRPLNGKPLMAWVIEAAQAAETLDRLVVSSDDEEALSIARSYDPALALRRPAELATDAAPAIGYVQHVLEMLEADGEGPFDATVILQPSSPLTLAQDIDATVRLMEESGADSAVSVTKLDHAVHPIKTKVLGGDRLYPYVEEEKGRMAAHDLPDLYVRNCAVYASRRHVAEAGEVIGEDCRGYLMPRERSVDINEEIDFQFAAFLLQR